MRHDHGISLAGIINYSFILVRSRGFLSDPGAATPNFYMRSCETACLVYDIKRDVRYAFCFRRSFNVDAALFPEFYLGLVGSVASVILLGPLADIMFGSR